MAKKIIGLMILLRPKQWVKNFFALAPLLFSGKFLEINSIINSSLTVILFCVASSAAYIINDIHDIEDDRRHPIKSKSRPLASGYLSITTAKLLLGLLFLLLALGWFILPNVFPVIAAYITLNLGYTYIFKFIPVVDIFSIAIGFVLRVYAGTIAIFVPESVWMFVTTLCLALYFAAIKRRQELSQSGSEGRKVLQSYSVSLVDRYAEMSATGALVFYSMFVMSTKPQLVVTIPLVLFGIYRYWYIVEELGGGESPTDVLLSDYQLLLTTILWTAGCVWALWPAR